MTGVGDLTTALKNLYHSPRNYCVGLILTHISFREFPFLRIRSHVGVARELSGMRLIRP